MGPCKGPPRIYRVSIPTIRKIEELMRLRYCHICLVSIPTIRKIEPHRLLGPRAVVQVSIPTIRKIERMMTRAERVRARFPSLL